MTTIAPPRVILCTFGSHGDIHPFIAVGLALKQRGADVVVATNPYFHHDIESAGLRFFPLGEFIDVRQFIRENPWMHNPRVAGIRLIRDIALPKVPEIQRDLVRLIAEFRPDAAVLHSLYLGASAVCEQHAIPWMSMVLSPVLWMSRLEPCCTVPFGPGGHTPPLWWWRFMRWMGTGFMRRTLNKPMNADRTARGLPPLKDNWESVTRGGALSLAMWPAAFRGPMGDDPAVGRICGFPFYDRGQADWPERETLERFLNDGPAPILFTLGTATVHDPRNFYENAANAASRLGKRAVLLIGRDGTPPARLPPGIITAGYAPFSWLMPRCCANVHHGGIGSTAQALRAGKPTVIVPHSHDQYDNAARCERLGTSVTLPAPRASVSRFESALRRTLDSPDIARSSRDIAPSMIADGAAAAADHVLMWNSRTSNV